MLWMTAQSVALLLYRGEFCRATAALFHRLVDAIQGRGNAGFEYEDNEPTIRKFLLEKCFYGFSYGGGWAKVAYLQFSRRFRPRK
jgi:hypothetical protein